MTDITGKKKIIVDDSIFADIIRGEDGQPSIGFPEYLGGQYISYAGKDTLRIALGKHWDYDLPAAQQPGAGSDFQRAAGGEKLLKGPSPPLAGDPDGDYQGTAGYSNFKVNVFCSTPLVLDFCEDDPTNLVDDGDEDTATQAEILGGTKQKIVLTCKVLLDSFTSTFQGMGDNLGAPGGTEPTSPVKDRAYWAYLMQYGITTPNLDSLNPIVRTGIDFYDHYHEAMAPFTPSELENQEPVGKAFFVDYSTFYNNRASSAQSGITNIEYENFIANPDYQNCLPNIYAFANIANNKELAQDGFFNLYEIIDGGTSGEGSTPGDNQYVPGVTLKYFYHSPGSGGEPANNYLMHNIRRNTYSKLFQYYPLEASLLLYGSLAGLKWTHEGTTSYQKDNPLQNTPTMLQILKLDAKKMDATSLFNKWILSFKRALSEDVSLLSVPTSDLTPLAGEEPDIADHDTLVASRHGLHPYTKLGALEYINSNLIFSPYAAASLLKKADRYKNYFPMYFEMNFTTQPSFLGDSVKTYKVGKFLASEIVAAQNIYGFPTDSGISFKQSNSLSEGLPFIDFMEKRVYEDLGASGGELGPIATFVALPAMDAPAYLPNSKVTIDLLNILNKWQNNEDWSSEHFHAVPNHPGEEAALQSGWVPQGQDLLTANTVPEGFWSFLRDSRNYMTYIRSNIDEPVNLDSDCNVLFKVLSGPAFKQKIIDIYNEKKRSYKDILYGKPAHAEDLFYLIKKFRKNINITEELNVQNIIIPNTSDLNIVNYIDTQVKYGTHATYRYEVYAYRVVFGSKYRYELFPGDGKSNPTDDTGKTIPLPFVDAAGDLQNLISGEPATANGSDFNKNGTGYNDDKGYTATYNIIIKPSIQLIGDMIFSTPPVKILDDPPVPPFVNVVPYRAVNNKIKVILDGSSDTFRAEPVIMLDGEDQKFNEIMSAQFSYDGKVRFSSDDRINGFDVFRTEERPTNYSDFELHPDEKIATIAGGSAAFDDLILPNKKYYYTFRARDNHNHVSNPTPVYEVELIDEKGAVKPLIRTITMEKKENKMPARECQKYILLKPTDNQINFSDDDPNINTIFSSNEEGKKKKYKMRLTSKGTGKKIDINFSFFKEVSSIASAASNGESNGSTSGGSGESSG